MNKIVAVTGMCGAGKTTVALQLKEIGYQYVRFGQVVMDILQKRNVAISEENERSVRNELRRINGMEAFAIANEKKITDLLLKGNVVIDGLYSFAEYKVLKKNWGKQFFTLAIYAPPECRYERVANRVMDDSDKVLNNRPLTNKQALARDYDEIENADKGGPIAIADWTIVNTHSIACLRKNVEEFLNA